jgi:DNA-binding transcriptional ArsR family regulator
MNTSMISAELYGFLRSIASESRLKILLLFMDGQERTVNQITGAVGLGQSTTSEHLANMKQSGILISEKHGKEVYYQPNRTQLIQQLEKLTTLLKKCCDL